MESKLRELLRDRADDARIEATIPAEVTRRASSRRKRNVALSALLTVAVVAASVVSIRAIVDVEPPSRPAAGVWPGIWPQDTREKAVLAQNLVDARVEGLDGDGAGPESLRESLDIEHLQDVLWQLDANEVAMRYAVQALGWPAASSSVDIDDDTAGPVTLSIDSCDPEVACKPAFRATVTLERLLRPDRFGLWFVTASDQTLNPQAASGLVEQFLAFRVGGYPVDDLLSAAALEIYDLGEAGLSLYGGEAGTFVEYEVVSKDPAGEDTFLFLVRLSREDGTTAESLLVGPGVNENGDPKPVLVLSVSRVEFQEIDETVPPPDNPSAGDADQVLDFVTAFMEARLASEAAETFLSAYAEQQYAEHEEHDPAWLGLYLHGNRQTGGDPRTAYRAFEVKQPSPDSDAVCRQATEGDCQEVWSVFVIIEGESLDDGRTRYIPDPVCRRGELWKLGDPRRRPGQIVVTVHRARAFPPRCQR